MVTNDGLLSRSSRFTLQEQLMQLMIDKIHNKEYKSGDKLPSVRELAALYQVSRETAKIALSSLKEMGYVEILPNRGAFVLDVSEKSMSSEKTGTLGIVFDIGNCDRESYDYHMVYDNLLRSVEKQAGDCGFHLMTSYLGFTDSENPELFWGMLEKIDGLLIACLYSEKLKNRLHDLNKPVVSILSNLELDGIDAIGLNNRNTYKNAASFFIERGCRRLLYIDGPEPYFQKAERFAGCMDAAEEWRGQTVEVSQINSRGWLPKDSRSVFSNYLAEGHKPDAVICVNDIIAAGVIQACDQAGLKIPGDVQIIGSKNTLVCHSTIPALSSIDYHYDGMAEMAVSRLVEYLSGTVKTPARIDLMGTFVQRESTGKRKE